MHGKTPKSPNENTDSKMPMMELAFGEFAANNVTAALGLKAAQKGKNKSLGRLGAIGRVNWTPRPYFLNYTDIAN